MTRQAVTKHLKCWKRRAGRQLWRGREKLHYLNPVPIHEIAERWIGKFERGRLRALADLKKKLEGETDELSRASSTSPTSAPRRRSCGRR